MDKIDVKIGWSGENFSCTADHAALNGIVVATSETVESLKKQFQESLQFHIEGCINDRNQLPEWLTNGQYELNYTLEISALLQNFDGILRRSAIARVAGINEEQIEYYASGYRMPRPQQKKKIINAFHSIGKELVSV